MEFLNRYGKYADIVLRVGLGFVFLYFGIDKFFHPTYWMGYIPSWFGPLLPVSQLTFIYFMGAVEAIVGAGIVFAGKVYSRDFAAVAGLLLIAISLGIGWNELTIRDLGLLATAVAITIRKQQ